MIKNFEEVKEGLYSTWTQEDIREYIKLKNNSNKQLTNCILTSYYMMMNAPLNNPTKRVRCLSDLFKNYKLINIETDSINIKAKEQGKAKALIELEDLIVYYY